MMALPSPFQGSIYLMIRSRGSASLHPWLQTVALPGLIDVLPQIISKPGDGGRTQIFLAIAHDK